MKSVFRDISMGFLLMIMTLFLLSVTAFASDEVVIEEDNFSDVMFRGIISEFDTDGSGGLSQEEIAKVKKINVNYEGITSLKGVEYFSSLEVLQCWGNGKLKDLDISKNTALKELSCNNCSIEELDVSKNTELVKLSCSNNRLQSLDISNNTKLKELFCPDNSIQALNVKKNTALEKLYCYHLDLQELDISKNPKLFWLECNGNEIKILDISNNSKLALAYLKGDKSLIDDGISYSYDVEDTEYYLSLDNISEITCLSITGQPKDKTVAEGKNATFSVTAKGACLKYQWYRQKKGAKTWTKLSGKTGKTLTVKATTSLNGSQYRCKVRCVGDRDTYAATSQSAKLTVVAKPKVTTQPVSATEKVGKTVTFKVKASGDSLKYQWYEKKKGSTKWTKLSGKTSATLKFTAKKKQNGYMYRCRVKNTGGTVFTTSVNLTVK